MTGRPLPSHGSSGASSPRSAVLSADSDDSTVLAPHFVAFAWRYLAFGPVRSHRPDPRRQAWAASYAAPAPLSTTRNDGALPGSWATLAYMPMLFDPGGVSAPGHNVLPLLPSAIPNTSAPRCHFRGSITQPARPLCTLRRRDRSRTTQHSVPVGGQPLPVRDLHPTGPKKWFRIVSSYAIVLPFQALPGATEL